VLPYTYEDFAFLSQNILHVLERVFADSRAMNGRELARYRTYVLNMKWIETTEDVYKLATDWYRSFVASAREGSGQRLCSFVADVKTIIDQALVDPDLSAKGIAARLKISVNYVRSTFKGATGESISTYITRLRIERCKELLESSGLPVKEIAEAVGFRNYTYFFTLFKKQTGRTPQEYQRRITIK
jgi:YesN/AraC family two-component response regulator